MLPILTEIPTIFTSLVGIMGWFAIILFPGSWIVFGLKLDSFPFLAKISISVALSPLVVFFEFYLLRALFGVSFAYTVWLLAAINFPVIILIMRRFPRIQHPDPSTAAAVVSIFAFIVLLIAPQIVREGERVFSGHSWLHSDIVYAIANGQLIPQEPEMAGIRLGYPWSGHVFQSCLSFLLDSPPMSSYIWTNLIWIICFYVFSYFITGELGGSRFSKITSFIWLSLGLNFVGFVLNAILPDSISHPFWLGGDYRYTPWLLKFFFFEQIMFGLALFAVLLYISIKKDAERFEKETLFLMFLTLLGIGILYPVLFPAGAVIVGAVAAAPLLNTTRTVSLRDLSRFWKLTAAGAFCALLTLIYLQFLTVERVSGSISAPTFSAGYMAEVLLKLQAALTAVSIYLIPVFLARDRILALKRRSLIIVGISAVGSILLHVGLKMPFWGNEYKFIFPAAVCLAPLAAVASESFFKRLGSRAVPVFICFAMILSIPLVDKIYNDFPWIPVPHPAADVSTFDINLADENAAEIFEEIRTKTDSSAVIAVKRTTLHFPTLTQRRLYAPPRQKDAHPGINVDSVDMVGNVRGLGKSRIEARRQTVETLVDGVDEESWVRARDEVLKFGSQIVLMVPASQKSPKWLARSDRAELLFRDENFTVWLLRK